MDWLKQGWRWSWIILLPFLAVTTFLGVDVVNRYLSVSIKSLGNVYLGGLSLQQTGMLEFDYRKRNLELDIRRIAGNLPADGLRKLQFFIAESDLAQLNSDLPASGYSYVPALMLYDDRQQKVKVRYRGDFHYHWAFHKKSLRIKTRKTRQFEGMRTFNLIVPKSAALVNNYLGYELAAMLGLVVPRHELVTLTINGRYQGFYLLAEQLNESTLRHNGLLPGDIYAGDQVFGDNLWFGIHRSLFDHPGLWDKAAVNNHYEPEHNAALVALLSALQVPANELQQAQLEPLLDLDRFARFSVLELLLNTQHYDMEHNWKLYYDPGLGQMQPVVWDPLGWLPTWLPGGALNTWPSDTEPPLYIAANSLALALYKNGEFNRIRAGVLEDFFARDLDKVFLARLQQVIDLMQPVVEKEPLVLTLELDTVDPDAARAAMTQLAETSQKIFSRLREVYYEQPGQASYSRQGDEIRLALESHRTAKKIRIRTRSPVPTPGRCEISYGPATGLQKRSVCGYLEADPELTLKLPLISDFRWLEESPVFNDFIRISAGVYGISLDGVGYEDVAGVDVSWDGQRFYPAAEVEEVPAQSFLRMANVLPAMQDPLHSWAGTVDITENTTVNWPLRIEAGSRIRLADGVSIFFNNQLQIKGTEDAPVIIEQLPGSHGPWGAIVLEGSNADGSILEHLVMRGGSGVQTPLRDYSGMLSIHGVRNVILRNCKLADNERVDDMLHAVYSSLEVEQCSFERAAFDALDMDMSELNIRNTSVLSAGNDGIDFMSSHAQISNVTITGSGDKALSVGEDSRVIATHSVFADNQIAIQAKDHALALLEDNVFEGNPKTLDAYYKNWRYGQGGRIIACRNNYNEQSAVSGLAPGISADKHSTLWLTRSLLAQAKVAGGNGTQLRECDELLAQRVISGATATMAGQSLTGRWWEELEQALNLEP